MRLPTRAHHELRSRLGDTVSESNLNQLYRDMAKAVEKGWVESDDRRRQPDLAVYQTPAFKNARPGVEH